jgi:hypothetical protein
MKRRLLSLFAIAFTGIAFAQMPASITMTPANASGKHLITLTFDPAKACDLDAAKQITTDDTAIYMHGSAHTYNPMTSWGNFGVDYNAEPGGGYTAKWEKNANGTFSASFIPQKYFKVPTDSLITGISFVLNVGSWDREGKDVDADGDGKCNDFKITLSRDTTNLNTAVIAKTFTSFTLYPNPVVDELKISNDKQISYIVVSDVIGKTVLKVAGNNYSQVDVATKQLQRGMYILSVYDVNGIAGTAKFLKK